MCSMTHSNSDSQSKPTCPVWKGRQSVRTNWAFGRHVQTFSSWHLAKGFVSSWPDIGPGGTAHENQLTVGHSPRGSSGKTPVVQWICSRTVERTLRVQWEFQEPSSLVVTPATLGSHATQLHHVSLLEQFGLSGYNVCFLRCYKTQETMDIVCGDETGPNLKIQGHL